MPPELTNNQKIEILNQAIQTNQIKINRLQGLIPNVSRDLSAELLKAEAYQHAGLAYTNPELETARLNFEQLTGNIQQAQQELQAFQGYVALLAASSG